MTPAEAVSAVKECRITCAQDPIAASQRERALVAEIERLQETLAAATSQKAREIAIPPSDEGINKCGHNSYWRGIYGGCMACRVAEGLARIQELVAERDMFRRQAVDHGQRREKAEADLLEALGVLQRSNECLEAATAQRDTLLAEKRQRLDLIGVVFEAMRKDGLGLTLGQEQFLTKQLEKTWNP